MILSLVQRLSLSQRSNNTLKYDQEVETSVLCREVCPYLGQSIIGVHL